MERSVRQAVLVGVGSLGLGLAAAACKKTVTVQAFNPDSRPMRLNIQYAAQAERPPVVVPGLGHKQVRVVSEDWPVEVSWLAVRLGDRRQFAGSLLLSGGEGTRRIDLVRGAQRTGYKLRATP